MLKKVLSYFVPINIHRQSSSLSKSLEVTWANGQLVLDSGNTNYSFGSLQRVLRKGLHRIGFERILQMQKILVLGVAGGSVIRTLIDEIGFQSKITGVEIDADVLALAAKFFNLKKNENLDLVVDDAFEFVLKTREKYDLIIIDIFQDTKMPGFLFEKFFVGRLSEIVQPNGLILFNTMILCEADEIRNKTFTDEIDPSLFDLQTLERIDGHNQLLLLQRV